MEPEPVGSVTEETARLLDALFGAAPADRPAQPATQPTTQPTTEPAAEPCPTCGHVPGGAHTAAASAEVCHLCPVCQLLRVVRAVRPETLDRLAELAAAVTDTLRDAAAARRRELDFEPDRENPTRAAGPIVEDIPVRDHELPDEREDGA